MREIRANTTTVALQHASTEALLEELIKRGGTIAQLGNAAQLQLKKSKDYNNGIVKLKDYFPFGLLSYAQMLHTKAMRLNSLASQSMATNGDVKPEFESVKDTALDMINYASFLADHLFPIDATEDAPSDETVLLG